MFRKIASLGVILAAFGSAGFAYSIVNPVGVNSVGAPAAVPIAAPDMEPSASLSANLVTGLVTGQSPEELTAGAPIVLLMDSRSGQILYSRNANRRFMPASITKVMSAYVAFELLSEQKLSLSQSFTMSAGAGAEWHKKGSTMFLSTGDEITVENLLRGITSVSANDASVVLAEGALGSVENWTARMNQTAAELKMHDSHFNTPNGWPDGGKTFTTAHDLELLANALITKHPALYARFFGKPGFQYNGISQINHDPISGVVEGADGIKTGFTNQAGNGFLGSAKRGNTRLIMVTAVIDNSSLRAEIAQNLIGWGFNGFDRKQWFDKGALIGDAQVQNGNKDHVGLRTSQPIEIAVPKGSNSAPKFRLVYEGPVKAPITAGEKIAALEVSVEGLPPTQIPLEANETIDEANIFQRISNAFKHWFG